MEDDTLQCNDDNDDDDDDLEMGPLPVDGSPMQKESDEKQNDDKSPVSLSAWERKSLVQEICDNHHIALTQSFRNRPEARKEFVKQLVAEYMYA